MKVTTMLTSEQNRIDSSRQQRFLAVLSEPLKPQEQSNSWRHKAFLTCTSSMIIVMSMTNFIFGIAENHRD